MLFTERFGAYMPTELGQGTAEMDNSVRRVAAASFKANCLRLMDEVARQRRPLVITKRGRPVAKLVPIDEERAGLFGRMAGSIRICGDIVDPVDDLSWTGDAENL